MLEITKQIKAINRILNEYNQCDLCQFKGVFMYRLHGAALCPYCDIDMIDDYKKELSDEL